jgi:NAD(P)-dependent dehydrogenase (short-subunit alcohol dehydrogenase family)
MINLNKLQLQDKVVVISGATGGIGESCAFEAAKNGAIVCLLGRNKRKLDEACLSLEQIGANYKSYMLNIRDDLEIKQTIESIVNTFNKIDGFIHAAGFEQTKPIRKTSRDDLFKLIDVNTISALCITKEILKVRKNNSSSISLVFISSIMGSVSNAGLTGYSASKGAMISAVKALAIEIAPKGNRINSVSPGLIQTNLVREIFNDYPEDIKKNILSKYPLGIGKPEDVANLSCFLLSEKSKWITGTDIKIDGGYTAK